MTAFAALIVTAHVPVPVQAPDQPEKDEPVIAEAVRVTEVPLLYASEQSPPQEIPEGLLDTDPDPAPALLTVRV